MDNYEQGALQQDRVLRLKEVQRVLGLSRSTIYDRINPKSSRYDPTFPKKINLGGSAVGWLSSTIYDWLHGRA